MIEYIQLHQADFLALGTALVTVFSVLANLVPKDTVLGKFVHFIALNFKK